MRDQRRAPCFFGGLIGASPQMQQLYGQIQKASQGTYPVVIRGETGTGKELVARSIHFAGAYRQHPFVPVDCPALSPGLLESELFGHVKGAFTGATQTTRGLMEMANGGTLFLDEIGDLPMVSQPKFLRALQEKEIRSVGSTHTIHLSIRIISATNRDLETAVKNNAFRQDLFFRLNVLQVTIPPLRERKADIPLLVMSFLQKFTESGDGDGSWTISEEAMKHLACYDWPGNVRELEHAIEYCVAFCSRPRIEIDDLPVQIRQKHSESSKDLETVLDLNELKRRAIASTLAKTKGDRAAAASILGIGKTTLYRKLKRDQQETKHSLTAPPIVHIA